MSKEQLIPKDELDHKTKDYIKETHGKFNYDALFNTDRKNWTEEQKSLYKNARAVVYARLRASLKEKANQFWFSHFTSGALKVFCNKHGIFCNRYGNTCCTELADRLVKDYLEKVFLPLLEKEVGLTGVKITRNASARAYNCLDFSRAKIVKSEKVE